MKELLFSLKKELKTLAVSIRQAKQSRKTYPNGYVPHLLDLQFKFRVNHIFRCLLRGRTLEQIENIRLTKLPIINFTEIRLHFTLSHMYNTYTDLKYESKWQCTCLKCNKDWKVSGL